MRVGVDMKLSKFLIQMAIFLGFTSMSLSTQASLIGDEVQADWNYVDYSQTSIFTAGVGIDVDPFGLGATLDVGANTISIDLTTDWSSGIAPIWAGVMWDFTSLDSTQGDIVGVTVDTNYVGWLDSYLSFTANSISIEFLNNGSYDASNDIFQLTLVYANNSDGSSNSTPPSASVPEAGTLAMLAIGLLGVAASRRKRV